MMDRNDTTGQSLILIDWDLCQYGYRVFDLAYYMFYGSFVHVAPFIGNEDFDYDDPGHGSSDVNQAGTSAQLYIDPTQARKGPNVVR